MALPVSGRWPRGSLQAFLEASASIAFVVLRGGRLGFEWYATRWDGSTLGRMMSVTQSVAALRVGKAVGDGCLPGIDAPIGELVDGIVDAVVALLTLAQLLRMASGIGYREGVLPWHDDAHVYHGTQLRRRVRRVRLVDAVDHRFHYNDWHPLLVALAFERAGSSLARLESGLDPTAYEVARLGQLVLQRGQWEGRTLVPSAWPARLDDLADAWRQPEHFAYYREHGLPWARPLESGHFAYKDFW